MPTQPDPDSPYMASRLEAALGVRSPGMPSLAGKPGVQAANVSYPAPPAVNTAQPGRPQAPRAPAPAAAVPQARTPTMEIPGQPQRVDMGTVGAPDGTSGAVPGVMPGQLSVPTPQGAMLTPEGDMRYRQAVMAGRERLGPIPKSMRHPTLPELPFELGRHNYNPFTGSWDDGQGQN